MPRRCPGGACHLRSPVRARGRGDLEWEILVLCSPCHRDVHEACPGVAEQKEILRYRPGHVRREMRKILDCVPKPYIPPEQDISRIYEEAGRINTCIFGI